jgi:hypothetical protein
MNRSPGSVTCWADCARSVTLGALLAVGHGPSHQRETKKIKRLTERKKIREKRELDELIEYKMDSYLSTEYQLVFIEDYKAEI